jgi:hypothetical protein
MTITEGLMTPAPSIEIAAALLAVQQKNTSYNSAPGIATAGKDSGSSSNMMASKENPKGGAPVAESEGWRNRVARKLTANMGGAGEGGAGVAAAAADGDNEGSALTAESQAPRYEEFLFCALCVSLLDVYTELIEELASNSFSVQSTGKRVNVRRMSTVAAPPPPMAAPVQQIPPLFSGAAKRGSKPLTDMAAMAAAATAGAGSENRNERVLSRTPGGFGANSQYPKSLSRSAEEYVFLKTAIQPLLLMSAFEAPSNVTIISDHLASDGSSTKDNEDYPSAEELTSATKIYIECFKRDRNML